MNDIIEKFFLLRKEREISWPLFLRRWVVLMVIYMLIYNLWGLILENSFFSSYLLWTIIINIYEIFKFIIVYLLLILLIKTIKWIRKDSTALLNINIYKYTWMNTLWNNIVILLIWIFYFPIAGTFFIFTSWGFADREELNSNAWIIFFINFIPFFLMFLVTYKLLVKADWKLQKTWNKYIDWINSIDVSEIEYIHFQENNWKWYKIKIDSIKKIAKYINVKYKKTVFEPNELKKEKDYLLKNYKRNLSQENYDTLVNTLNDWVMLWGSFEIVTY
jgi:hypothetical protein